MFVIKCPYCGERDQSEFSHGGEAHIDRPEWRDDMTDAEWSDFVFLRHNEKGVIAERWMHAAGCGKWFNGLRNTITDEIYGFYKIGEEPPKVDAAEPATPAGELLGSGNDAVKVVVELFEGDAK